MTSNNPGIVEQYYFEAFDKDTLGPSVMEWIMQYRLQEDKEFFPKHLILNGPLTDANYDLIKNQLQKAGQKQRQVWIGDIILV